MLSSILKRIGSLLGAIILGGWSLCLATLDWFGRATSMRDALVAAGFPEPLLAIPWWWPGALALALTAFLIWINWPARSAATAASAPTLDPTDKVTSEQTPVASEPSPRPDGDIMLLAPDQLYSIVWDPPYEITVNVASQIKPGEDESSRHYIPIFYVKNIGSAIAKDVKIVWRREDLDWKTILSSSRIRKFDGRVEGDYFKVESNGPQLGMKQGWMDRFDEFHANDIAYLAPEVNNVGRTETTMGYGPYTAARIYFAATMPDSFSLQPVIFSFIAAISWTEPKGKATVGFRVQALATSHKGSPNTLIEGKDGKMRPEPEVTGVIRFVVTQMTPAYLIEA